MSETHETWENKQQDIDDSNEYDDYRPSYEGYGGAYGYDTIDSAIEDDPKNY